LLLGYLTLSLQIKYVILCNTYIKYLMNIMQETAVRIPYEVIQYVRLLFSLLFFVCHLCATYLIVKRLKLPTCKFAHLQLATSKTDLKKSQDELAKMSKEFESTKTELKKMKDCKVKLDETQKQVDSLKKKSTDVDSEVIAFI